MALKEHFTVFIFCLALKKKCILRSRRRRIIMFGALSYSANELNLAVAPPFVGQMKKNFRSFLSTPLGADMAKKPSHATDPLMTERLREEINKPV